MILVHSGNSVHQAIEKLASYLTKRIKINYLNHSEEVILVGFKSGSLLVKKTSKSKVEVIDLYIREFKGVSTIDDETNCFLGMITC